ncbi:phage shock protein operon transcriptional activator [Vibrio agarilyticus]|uniref:phage shock protein operon transcriptional activator n=1 Tax=Vibrio agarilyticus TaxID=2726741 RepID=UPI003F6DB980
MLDQVSRLAPIERPVLIIGERGTGKELIAQRLHYLSQRWDKPLVTLNCAALNEHLVDSELFGHEAGAFTGAKGTHSGRFERAEGGTLFLDELATTTATVQEKLLRVIEYGEYERVGGHRARRADVRLICATNANLPEMAESGDFRADLLDRLAFDVILLPPLRHRREDIMLLAEHYAIKMCRELALDYFVGFSDNAKHALLTYSWPGNVRELKNVVERAIYHHGQNKQPIDALRFNPFQASWQTTSQTPQRIDADAFENPPQNQTQTALAKQPIQTTTFPIDFKQWQAQQEHKLVSEALKACQFNQKVAAELLGLNYNQLRGLVRKHQLVGR